MKKLSNAHIARRNALAFELQLKIDVVNESVADLNKTIETINEFVEEIHSKQQDYYDERSEQWQEGDAGTDYSAWMDEWQFSLEELSDPTDDVDLDGFESLPEQAR